MGSQLSNYSGGSPINLPQRYAPYADRTIASFPGSSYSRIPMLSPLRDVPSSIANMPIGNLSLGMMPQQMQQNALQRAPNLPMDTIFRNLVNFVPGSSKGGGAVGPTAPTMPTLPTQAQVTLPNLSNFARGYNTQPTAPTQPMQAPTQPVMRPASPASGGAMPNYNVPASSPTSAYTTLKSNYGR